MDGFGEVAFLQGGGGLAEIGIGGNAFGGWRIGHEVDGGKVHPGLGRHFFKIGAAGQQVIDLVHTAGDVAAGGIGAHFG